MVIKQKTSPHIDLLVKRGVLFKNAISQAPWTYPSHASMLTSQYPSALGYKIEPLGVLSTPYSILPKNAETLAEILRRSGYFTGGFVGGGPVGSRQGFSQGYSIYNEKVSNNLQTRYNTLRNWITLHQKEKFFLFFHTFEVHDYKDNGKVESQISSYDEKIKAVDAFIGMLENFLKRLSLEKKTLVIITSDHGEEFYDHGFKGHGYSLYDEMLNVPLIFYMPGTVPENKIITQQVSLVDIMPTILDILDIPANKNLEGVSLSSFSDNKIKDRIAYSEGTSFKEWIKKINPTSVRTNNYKFIEYPLLSKEFLNELSQRKFLHSHFNANSYQKNVEHELYNISNNPKELNNQMINDESLVAKFSKKIETFKLKNQRKWQEINKGNQVQQIEMDEETRNRLKALGYLQ
tara:strand:+ start:424 stop:1638 length:1215 start_codon:yes stop_codon:yes gene_type:complete